MFTIYYEKIQCILIHLKMSLTLKHRNIFIIFTSFLHVTERQRECHMFSYGTNKINSVHMNCIDIEDILYRYCRYSV